MQGQKQFFLIIVIFSKKHFLYKIQFKNRKTCIAELDDSIGSSLGLSLDHFYNRHGY